MIKQAIGKKLKSNTGASLSVALLLFLVCAVLGSVILKSGTAASGRIADMAEADARYYSVTSAADYLADAITTAHIPATPTSAARDENRTVTVTKTAVKTTTETSSYDGEDWSTPSASPTDTKYTAPVIRDNTSTGAGTAETILTRAVQDAFFGGTIADADACWSMDKPSLKASDGSDTGQKDYNFSLQFTRGNAVDTGITAYVKETIRNNGDIVLTVSDAEDEGDAGYRVQMVFVLTSKTNSSSTTRTSASTTGSAETNDLVLKETTKTTETKTTTCFWTLAEIRKVN